MSEHDDNEHLLAIYANIATELTSRGYNAEAFLEKAVDGVWCLGVRLTDDEAAWDPVVDIDVFWEYDTSKWVKRRTNNIRVTTKTFYSSRKTWPQRNDGRHNYVGIVDAWLVARADSLARLTAEEVRERNYVVVNALKQRLNIDVNGHEGFNIRPSVHADKTCEISFKMFRCGNTAEAEEVFRALAALGYVSLIED